MENVLDLKMSGAIELGNEELKKVEGGTPQLTMIGIKIVIAVDSFMQGFVDGYKANDYKPE